MCIYKARGCSWDAVDYIRDHRKKKSSFASFLNPVDSPTREAMQVAFDVKGTRTLL